MLIQVSPVGQSLCSLVLSLEIKENPLLYYLQFFKEDLYGFSLTYMYTYKPIYQLDKINNLAISGGNGWVGGVNSNPDMGGRGRRLTGD